jgi:LysM repeat protein
MLLALMFTWVLSACAGVPAVSSLTPTASATVALTPYYTQTPTATSRATQTPRPEVNILPTPTPFIHVVKPGETLGGIALLYGLETADLLAANPEVNPNLLSIDTEIVIPLGEQGEAALPTPAPLPVELGEPACYPTVAGDLWCFTLARNTLNQPVESLGAQMVLTDLTGASAATTHALPPVNLLPVGSQLPLVAYFSAPVPEEYTPVLQLSTAFPAGDISGRYLPVEMNLEDIQIDPAGIHATVTGTVRLLAEEATSASIRLAAIAYDPEGRVVGVRIWETQTTENTAQAIPFDFTVYSLGEKIERVEVFSEARPIP